MNAHAMGECREDCEQCRADLLMLKQQRSQYGKAGPGVAKPAKPDLEKGSFRRGDQELVRAMISEFRDNEYFSLRVWYRDENEGGKIKPSKNGINLRMDEQDDFLKLVVELFGFERIENAVRAFINQEEQ